MRRLAEELDSLLHPSKKEWCGHKKSGAHTKNFVVLSSLDSWQFVCSLDQVWCGGSIGTGLEANRGRLGLHFARKQSNFPHLPLFLNLPVDCSHSNSSFRIMKGTSTSEIAERSSLILASSFHELWVKSYGVSTACRPALSG